MKSKINFKIRVANKITHCTNEKKQHTIDKL